MDLENIFRDVKLSKTEMTVLHQVQYHHAEARCHQRYRLYEHSAGGGADAAAGKPRAAARPDPRQRLFAADRPVYL